MSQVDLALLLRLNQSFHDGISAEELYEITRAWWVMSPANAQRVARVLAVAGGVVREVYRHRPVKEGVSTERLAQALASMTRRVDLFADKAGYDVS